MKALVATSSVFLSPQVSETCSHVGCPGSPPPTAYRHHSFDDPLTDAKWLQYHRPGSASAGQRPASAGGRLLSAIASSSDDTDGNGDESMGPSLQDGCWLVGTASGCLQLHRPGGEMFLRQRLHTSAVKSIALRGSAAGTWPGSMRLRRCCCLS